MVNVKTWATEEKRKANGFAAIESFMKKLAEPEENAISSTDAIVHITNNAMGVSVA